MLIPTNYCETLETLTWSYVSIQSVSIPQDMGSGLRPAKRLLTCLSPCCCCPKPNHIAGRNSGWRRVRRGQASRREAPQRGEQARQGAAAPGVQAEHNQETKLNVTMSEVVTRLYWPTTEWGGGECWCRLFKTKPVIYTHSLTFKILQCAIWGKSTGKGRRNKLVWAPNNTCELSKHTPELSCLGGVSLTETHLCARPALTGDYFCFLNKYLSI